MRLNWAFGWTNGDQAGHYDIQSIGAHEMGHGLGFSHAAYNNWMVMWQYGYTDDITKRFLGLGDWEILDFVYP